MSPGEHEPMDLPSLPAPLAQAQLRLWRLERAGWIALAVLAPLVLFGLLRKGPLSWVEVSAARSELTVRYERMPRQGELSLMLVRAKAGADGRVWLTLSGPLAERFALVRIRPRPEAVETYASGLRLRFETAPYGLLFAEVVIRPAGTGLASSTVGMNNQAASVTQWVLP